MSEATRIAIVVSAKPWADELHGFTRDHGGAQVVARILESREAFSHDYAVLLADDSTSFLTARFVGELRRSGRRVLAVHDPKDAWAPTSLQELGVDQTAHAEVGPEALLRLAAKLADDIHPETTVTPPVAEGPLATPIGPATNHGQLVAVSGPHGAPGRTEIALGIATAIRKRKYTCTIADTDDVAPSLAQRLGLEMHPNLRTAVEVGQHRPHDLYRTTQPLATGLEVIVGLANGRDWPHIRPDETVDVLQDLRSFRDFIVCDTGPSLEALGGLSTVGRFDLTRAVVARADRLVVVAKASPVGLVRLLDWLSMAGTLSSADPIIVFNQAHDRFKRSELRAELEQAIGPSTLHFVGHDPRQADAVWDGHLPRRGCFNRDVDRLVEIEFAHRRDASRDSSVPSPERTAVKALA